jgi:hypothetical protein
MARADHIRVRFCWKGLVPYWHHGIDMGDGTVIHFTSGLPLNASATDTSTTATQAEAATDGERLAEMKIRRTSMQEFHWGNKIEVVKHPSTLDEDVVAQRAIESVGEQAYLLSHNNCEHFATWCKVGTARSWQVEGMETLAQSTISATAKSALAIAAKKRVTSVALMMVSRPVATAAAAIKPIFLLADVAEYCSYVTAQKMGYSDDNAKSVSRWTGRSTAAAIGMVTGGPAGAAAAVTVHEVTGRISESICGCVKKQIAPQVAS